MENLNIIPVYKLFCFGTSYIIIILKIIWFPSCYTDLKVESQPYPFIINSHQNYLSKIPSSSLTETKH